MDWPALKLAARAAIVTAGVFAFADKVIGNQSTALFAAIGSFALLGLTQLTGPPGTRVQRILLRGRERGDLTFVLSATVSGGELGDSDRIAGWGLAAGVATGAAMLLWPLRRSVDLQHETAQAVRSVADVVDADGIQLAERGRIARAAVDGLRWRLLGTQHARPVRPAP